MERRLTAILATDVHGYSKHVAMDDVATVASLKLCRATIAAQVTAHRGRVVDNPGDNLLAEFASVVDAVRAAVAIQQALHAAQADGSRDRELWFRIGIAMGDVIVDDGRIYGDGVNLAARLEAQADPGGICLSAQVHQEVAPRLPLEFEYVGERALKNMPRPLAVWRIGGLPGATALTKRVAARGYRQWLALALGAITVLGVSLYGALHTPVVDVTRASAPVTAPTASLPLPDKPSLVVLPFANLSGDLGQDYLSDGITEDLTTDMAKLAGLFVISRSTAFTYKGKAVALPTLGRELGVRYVVQGSVQKMQDRLRITAQLLEAGSEQHLWSERYDRPATDLFVVQDEIRQRIVTALSVKLSPDEQARFARAPTDNLDAYYLYLKAMDTFAAARRQLDRSNVDHARKLLQEAIDLDENYAAAYGALALIDWVEWTYEWNPAVEPPAERVRKYAERALMIDPATPGIRRILAGVDVLNGQWDAAVAEAEREIALHPSDGEAYRTLAGMLALAGRPKEAVDASDRARRLSPRYPPHWAWQLGLAYRYGGRTADALQVLQDGTARAPNVLSNHLVLAAIYAEEGEREKARDSVAAIRRISPSFSADDVRRRLLFRDPAMTQAYVDALRGAGLP